MRVAFLGPEGTFSEEALLASPEADHVDPVAEPTVYECVMAVHAREVERALVPIENSLEGSVNATLDALVFETEEVTIIGETGAPDPALPDRPAVPGAGPRSSGWSRIPRRTRSVRGSSATRLAERQVDLGQQHSGRRTHRGRMRARPWAALGNRLSAQLYGCQILEAGVEDIPENETRFVWLAREQAGGAARWRILEDVDRLLGPARHPGCARRRAAGRSPTRASTSARSSRGPSSSGSAATSSSPTSKASSRRPRSVMRIERRSVEGRNASRARLLSRRLALSRHPPGPSLAKLSATHGSFRRGTGQR